MQMININGLYHHGIKGQKWGVRRFQNKDGSLTSAGKQRYYDDDEVIKKGTKIYRVANSDEKIDSKRKYVSITSSDRENYKELAKKSKLYNLLGFGNIRAMPIDFDKPISEFMYEAKKDLRVVSGERVVNDIVDKYGDKNSKYLLKNLMAGKLNKYDNIDEIELYAEIICESFMDEHGDEIISNYKNQGYDGMVDPTDWVAGISEYPIILLNPSTSIDLKNKEKIF